MPDIFLSYNREDQSRAKLFAEGFERAALKVWWDVGLRTGEAVLLVATAAHRPAIVRQIEAAGYATEALVRSRQLVFLDAD